MSILELSAILAIVAAGQTLVIMTGGIDLSIAGIMNVVAFVIPALAANFPDDSLIPVVLAVSAGGMIGLLNGVTVTCLKIHPLIATLAMSSILYGAVLIATGGSAASTTNNFVDWVGSGRVGFIPAATIIWLPIAVAIVAILRATTFGTYIAAIGENHAAARLSGIPIFLTTALTYGLNGMLVGIAATILVGYTGQSYVGIGSPYLLLSIAAVVLGGTSITGGKGNYLGTALGALAITSVTATTTMMNFSDGDRQIIFGIILIALLIVYSRARSI